MHAYTHTPRIITSTGLQWANGHCKAWLVQHTLAGCQHSHGLDVTMHAMCCAAHG